MSTLSSAREQAIKLLVSIKGGHPAHWLVLNLPLQLTSRESAGEAAPNARLSNGLPHRWSELT